MTESQRKRLFVGCFIALIATSVAFMIRAQLVANWQADFALTETQKGEILGAGLWPFAITIILFSLIIDRIGYGKAMIFAFACHMVSTALFVKAQGYWALYWGSILNALAAGTVEAVINPVVASMYPNKKTKMLTILHAGWSGGIVILGIIALTLGDSVGWRFKAGLLFIPTILYGLVLFRSKFPVNERVLAGVSYRDMLREAGAITALIASFMIVSEIARVFGWPPLLKWLLIIALPAAYYVYSRSMGRPMYIFLVLVMILLAITELGTDAWITELRDPAMRKLGLRGGWILVYSASIMTILRFMIAPIEKVLKPLSILLISSIFAAVGLYFLATAEVALMILATATIYGIGQSFFWPVTLGLVAEQFPRGGALTLNTIAGIGMIGVGILGAPLLGFIQDTNIDSVLAEQQDEAVVEFIDPEMKESVMGEYRALDMGRVKQAHHRQALYEAKQAGPEAFEQAARAAYRDLLKQPGVAAWPSPEQIERQLDEAGLMIDDEATYIALTEKNMKIDAVRNHAKENAMQNVAVLPTIMALCYAGLIIYFRRKGGYQPVGLELNEPSIP